MKKGVEEDDEDDEVYTRAGDYRLRLMDNKVRAFTSNFGQFTISLFRNSQLSFLNPVNSTFFYSYISFFGSTYTQS